jgi:osmotically-inducible protein OsmY
MKADNVIKQDVDAELGWNPELDETDIATKVQDGIVMLSGFARTFHEKHLAEVTVKRVAGVTAVANDLQVRPAAGQEWTDPEVARAAVAALKAELPLSWETIKPIVHEGRVFLEGTVEWHFQRLRAESAMRRVPGVMSVRNSIQIAPRVAATDIKHKIEDAFRRHAAIDADQVTVEASGSEVTLRGEVRSWAERDQAQASAWSAPGVTNVVNELHVRV